MERAVDEHQKAVREAVNGIVDPCSAAMAESIGLADMGIVKRVRVDGDRVDVELLPTSPHCLFLGLFEEEIESRVGALPWVGRVAIRHAEDAEIWDEGRMSAGARERLARRRRGSE